MADAAINIVDVHLEGETLVVGIAEVDRGRAEGVLHGLGFVPAD